METKTFNGVSFYQDWDKYEGAICMVNPKTIKRDQERTEQHPKAEDYGVFFAFNTEQFEQGKQRLIKHGYIKEDDKLCEGGGGLYGTREEIKRFYSFYNERTELIRKECNPQEVYFFEWNNHECMFSNDDSAFRLIRDTFGYEVAHTIKRVLEGTPANILAPLTERDKHLGQFNFELKMLGRLKFDLEGFFSEGDCRYHRPRDLWAGDIKGQIEEMRKLYYKLPDDIKDASCMTIKQIEDYAKRLEEWACEEFGKPEYNPKPRTPYEQYKDLEISLNDALWYKDDDGHWQHPNYVWFSHDSRRWHKDESCVAGRAFTTYAGSEGTTLTPVYITDDHGLSVKPFSRPDLCDVTAYYDNTAGNYRLYNFFHE